ncbi:hypothetical protein LSAT2_015303 [Lamellibrachia satsuma]|nr:hypothetical protein LSAT2_015303 [Lamellibrachia satsuma]
MVTFLHRFANDIQHTINHVIRRAARQPVIPRPYVATQRGRRTSEMRSPDGNWQVYRVWKLCTASTFEIGCNKLPEAEYTSDLHSGDGTELSQKRKKEVNNVLLQQLAVRGGTNTTNTSTDLPTGITLPITSLEDLQAVETILQDKAAIKQMIGALSFIGGITTVDTMRRMMSYVMTNATAKSCNWRGKNDKVAFSRLKLWDVVCGAVHRNPCTQDAKNTDVECTLKQWLRFAADRDGGRHQREHRRRQQLQHM